MKKNIISYLAISALVAVSVSAFAQSKSFNPKEDSHSKELVFDESKASLADPAPVMNRRAVKDFNRSFKNSSNIRWFEYKNGYTVKFDTEGKQHTVYYDKKGRWNGTVSYYREDKLPKNIRHLVKSVYYDYDIVIVIEVNVGDKTAHLVKIEDATSLKTIRVVDGELDEYESFTKGWPPKK